MRLELCDFSTVESEWNDLVRLLGLQYTVSGNYGINRDLLAIVETNESDVTSTSCIKVTDENATVGLIPITNGTSGSNFLSDYCITGYFPVCTAQALNFVFENFQKPLEVSDLHPLITDNSESSKMYRQHANYIDLTGILTLDQYIMSVKKKVRTEFRKVLRENIDLKVKLVRAPQLQAFSELLKVYSNNWSLKNDYSIANKIRSDNYICNCYEAIDLAFYAENDLIAVNRSIVEGYHSQLFVTDYLCVQSAYQRSNLGVYAILKNIEYAISMGYSGYNLGTDFSSSSQLNYKKKFINSEYTAGSLKSWRRDVYPPYYDMETKQWCIQ